MSDFIHHSKKFYLFFLTFLLISCTGETISNNQDSVTDDPGVTVITPEKLLLTISWLPGDNSNGIISGYTVNIGKESGTYNKHIDVGNALSATLSGIDIGFEESGTYYFTVNAYTSNDTESVPSTETSLNISL